MEPTPPNSASLDCRLSFFHVEMRYDNRLLKASLSILTSSAMADPLLEGGKEDSELKEAGKLCHGRSLFTESALIDYDIPILARFDTNKKRATRLADGLKNHQHYTKNCFSLHILIITK